MYTFSSFIAPPPHTHTHIWYVVYQANGTEEGFWEQTRFQVRFKDTTQSDKCQFLPTLIHTQDSTRFWLTQPKPVCFKTDELWHKFQPTGTHTRPLIKQIYWRKRLSKTGRCTSMHARTHTHKRTRTEPTSRSKGSILFQDPLITHKASSDEENRSNPSWT